MHPSAHVDTFTRDHLPPPEQWPTLLFDLPEFRHGPVLNAAAALIDGQLAAGRGDAPAIHALDGDRLVTWTYAELARRVDAIANVLTGRMGLVPGNRVLLRGPNNPMMAACWLAVVKAGLVAVATMPLLRSKELAQVVRKAQVTAALCDARLADELAHCLDPSHEHHCPMLARALLFDGLGRTQEVGGSDGGPGAVGAAPGTAASVAGGKPLEPIEPLLDASGAPFPACPTASDDVALIAFTSGTTGEPKGTMHFHRDVIIMCDAFPPHVLKPTPDDIFCGTPPLAFTFGLGGMLCFPMRAGASTLLVERLTPETLLAAIAKARATICFTAPTFWRQMAPLVPTHDIVSLTKCVSAGEALPDATRQLWKEATGIEIIDGLGSTEMIHIFIASAGADVRRGTVGKPIPGYQACIVDEAMNPLPPGTVGRLAVRGPTGCRYLADERQRNYVRDGWNLTGDTFTMDADGYFVYQARSDDMIISAGYNIAGPEVESALLTHPAVAECGVIGASDPERGQVVKAFVVLKPGHARDAAMAGALQEHVKAAIAPYKYPRVVQFVDALPRTETGKLQRFKLRDIAAD